MIQELLMGGMVEQNKIIPNIPSTITTATAAAATTTSCSSSSSPLSSATATIAAAASSEPLRCPRCDSSNTKFCYYNNYNLTQPRHFCKTCRRYWTKGGALRNVPIGGGCRKAKASTSPSAASAAAAKPRQPPSAAAALDLPPWAAPPPPPHASAHLMALLRATAIPYPNPNPNPVLNPGRIKEDVGILNAHKAFDAMGGALSAQSLSIEALNNHPCTNSNALWRHNNHHSYQQPLLGAGIEELHQRFKPLGSNYSDQLQAVIGNAGGGVGSSSMFSPPSSASSYSFSSNCSTIESAATIANASNNSTTILETIPLSGGDLGYWNPAMAWSDPHAAIHGAFP